MTSIPASQGSAPLGWIATVAAGARAGALCGSAFGVVDGIVALCVGREPIGARSAIGCVAASALLYSLVWIPAFMLGGLGLHGMLRSKSAAQRFERMLAIGLALWITCEVYWWSRPYVFYGRSSVSPERLAATGAIVLAGMCAGFVLARFAAPRLMAVQRSAFWCCVAIWSVGAVFLGMQVNALGSKGAVGERNADLPNVLLIVVDALRHDVLGATGHPRVETPALDRLAQDGVLFEKALVQAPFTWTSFGSMLTGKYPRRHGLVKMKPGVRMVENATLPWHLKHARRSDGVPLSDDDYLAATFHTGTLTAASGLLHGFDMRFEATAGHELVVLDQAWSVFRSDLLLFILKNKLAQRFDSGVVASEAKAWLARHGQKRFVAMVHLYSTHTPYDAPSEFEEKYVDPAYTGPFATFYAHHREAIERGELTPTDADVAQIRNLYFAGVTQADHLIGELLAELEQIGVRENTLVIATSDHGESLGEHGLWEHNHMVQTNLRVPLIMSWPAQGARGLPRGVRVRGRVDQIDLLPTVCDLIGIAPPTGSDVRDIVDGVSLLPWIHGAGGSPRAHSFAENGTHLAVQSDTAKLIVRHELMEFDTLDDALAEVKRVEQAIARAKAASGPVPLPIERPRLYDLVNDPDEDVDLLAQRGDLAAELFTALKEWDRVMPIPRSHIELSHRDLESQQRFQALGYTDGIGADPTEDP